MRLNDFLDKDPERKVAYYTLTHLTFSTLAGSFEIALMLRILGSVPRLLLLQTIYYAFLYFSFLGGTLLIRDGKADRNFRLDQALAAATSLYAVLMFGHLTGFLALVPYYLLRGSSEGVFWATRHNALMASTSDAGRDRFMLKLQSFQIIETVVLPLGAGLLISFLPFDPPWANACLPRGYFFMYCSTFVILIVSLALSPGFRIPKQGIDPSHLLALAREGKSRPWIAYQAFTAVHGVSTTIAVGILNFYILKTEFNLGVFTSAVSFASSMFFLFIMARIRGKRPDRLKWSLFGFLGEVLSRVTYFFFYSFWGLVAKSLIDSFLVPLRGIFGDNIVKGKIGGLKREKGASVAEGYLFQESVIFLSRLVILLTLALVISFFPSEPVKPARAILLLFCAGSLIDFFFLRRLSRT
jgi:hypothetical protein